MRYLVLGSGLMGRAVAFDLLRHKDTKEIRLADIDETHLNFVENWLNDSRIQPIVLDVNSKEAVLEAMKDINTVIGCISYTYNFDLTTLAIQSGANYCDLGGNNTVVQKQFSLDDQAIEADVTVIPDCGLAPGVASVIVAAAVEQLDSIEGIHIRVGGLPQNPKPPLNYSLIFSVQGLTNEYIEIAEVIRDGKITRVESMTEREELVFPEPFGTLEAFQTSGGTSTLPRTFLGKVKELDYKTIRYPGHCEKMKAILDLGFRNDEAILIDNCKISPRKFLEKMLEQNLTYKGSKDVTLVRVEAIGIVNEIKTKITYQIIDFYDEENNITSMMRMTSYPTAIIARMMAIGEIKKKGVIVQEFNVPSKRMLEELKKRDIKIDVKIEQL